MAQQHIMSAIEAILFASGLPVEAERFAATLECDVSEVHAALSELMTNYENEKRGIKIVRLEQKYQMCSDAAYGEYVRQVMDHRRNLPLSNAALEILSIVAYNQPVTKSYVEQIRGVDCFYGVNSLLEKGLLQECGRLDAPGRPILYKTTDEFLRVFGISSVDELPELPKIAAPSNEIEGQEKMAEV